MPTSHLCLRRFLYLIIVIATFNSPIPAQETGIEEPSDFVPLDLKRWSFEFWMNSHERHHWLVTLDHDGRMSAKWLREDRRQREDLVKQLPAVAVRDVFAACRDLFNRYRIVPSRVGPDTDVNYFVRLADQGGRSIGFSHLNPKDLQSPIIAAPLLRIDEILEQHGAGLLLDTHVIAMKGTPVAERPKERLPERDFSWYSRFHKVKGLGTGRMQNEFVIFDENSILLRRREIQLGSWDKGTTFPAQPVDTELRQSVTRKLLSRFRLRNAPTGEAPRDRFLLEINTGYPAEFVFERDLLLEAGVLDEWNDWIGEINRRRKDSGKGEFVAPWAK